jgi:hypothetical protein
MKQIEYYSVIKMNILFLYLKMNRTIYRIDYKSWVTCSIGTSYQVCANWSDCMGRYMWTNGHDEMNGLLLNIF